MAKNAELEFERARGNRAKEIVNDPVFKEAYDNLEEEIVTAWKNSAGPDDEVRDNAYLMLRLLGNLRQQFTTMIATGKEADKRLLELRDPSKVKRMFVR